MTDTGPLVSICINCFNYEQFVGQAIESALAQRGARTQVIVVDDGSTDGSAAVIESYVPDVLFIQQENGGQAAAMNAAFAHADGDFVIFLDADDELDPTCAARAVAAAGPGVAKVHWRLRLVDGDGVPFGENPSPGARLAEGDVQGAVVADGWYATVPTSGNCFTRSALEALMPIPVEEFRIGSDAFLILGVAFIGSVAAIEEPLTSYRVHTSNRFATRDVFPLPALQRRLEHAETLDAVLPSLAARFGVRIPPGTVLGHPEFRLMRLVDMRANPGAPAPAVWRAGFGLARSALRSGGMRPRRRLLLALVGVAMPLLPPRVVEHVRDVAFAGKAIRARPGGNRPEDAAHAPQLHS